MISYIYWQSKLFLVYTPPKTIISFKIEEDTSFLEEDLNSLSNMFFLGSMLPMKILCFLVKDIKCYKKYLAFSYEQIH